MTIIEEPPEVTAPDPCLYDAGTLPSWSRLPQLPASLPKTILSENIDVNEVATLFIKNFPALEARNFIANALWRDTFALTGTMRTFYTATSIGTAWNDVSKSRAAENFVIIPNSARIMRCGSESAWVEVRFEFKTTANPATTCSGFLSLVPDMDGEWKIWVLRTILEQLEGQNNVDDLKAKACSACVLTNGLNGHAVNGISNGTNGHTSSTNGSLPGAHFDCVVVGAGQAGLSVGGRLKALGVSYVIVDTISQIGDNWLSRYDSTRLHTNREYAHLPFERTFTPDYQEYLTKYDLAKGYKEWAKKYDVNVWLETKLESGFWVNAEKRWNLKLLHNGDEQIVNASHVVFAVGAGCQVPLMPKYPHKEEFKGLILHSHYYKSATEWKGNKGVIIGSANTAHDVAEDMVDAGMSSITMVQRARTYVLPIEYFLKASKAIYNSTVPTELADRIQFSNPVAVGRLLARTTLNRMASEEPERFDALERAGFKTERYGEITHHINERLGGHYMDVGASAKIAKGLIKMKSDAEPISYTRNGLKFDDGSEIEADVIVFATGFLGNVRQVVGSILGREVQDKVEDFWGLNPEGELYGAFKPSGHPGLWYIGGAIGHARYFSRFIALQIKADVIGTPLPVYERVFFPVKVDLSKAENVARSL